MGVRKLFPRVFEKKKFYLRCVKTLISRDKGKFTKKSPLNRSQRRSGSHEHYPNGSSRHLSNLKSVV
jgi:hypothetical protein